MGVNILIVALGVVVLLLGSSILPAFFSPTRKIPGPLLARFSRLWYLSKIYRGDFEITNKELHRRHGVFLHLLKECPDHSPSLGPIVRIAPNQFSIDDPESMKTIYGHGSKFVKSAWYDASGNPHSQLKDLFTERDPQRHAAFRRKVASLYSMTSLLRMESSADHSIDLLLALLSDRERTPSVIHVPHIMQCYAFDVVGDITMSSQLGKRFGFLDRAEDPRGIFTSLHTYLKYSAMVGVFPEFHPLLFGVMLKCIPGGLGKVLQFVQEQITDRLANPKPIKSADRSEDFLGEVLRLREEQPDAFTFEHVFTTCMTNIGAGSDTTSISLSSIIYFLINSPTALQKLRAEIEEKLPTARTRNQTYQEVQKLPYLQACIKEALRMHPATGLPLSRIVPDGGTTVAGMYLPQGSVVGVNTWIAHRNQTVFGPDADTFRPERWLQDDKVQLSRMEAYYLPSSCLQFGTGSRTCIGKNISLMEITKLIPRLLITFDFELVGAAEDVHNENVWFVKPKNFFARVRPRT
ncbi:cytochrome protein [Aureobasidium pullulans]|uniref:Cytochrome protein n=1 Tax=Aureobasidium pullulans TaxID=5580 RepID=A0A4S8X4Q0_AURPU|nr:cytochrome protein [Aureobasidium pullulans]